MYNCMHVLSLSALALLANHPLILAMLLLQLVSGGSLAETYMILLR